MKKFIFVLLIFISGFLVHALFFPDFLYDGLHTFPALKVQSSPTKQDAETGAIEFFTYINYTGVNFDKRNVKIRHGNYLAITNVSSQEGMLLESDNPVFNTGRSYGLQERVQTRMDEVGTFHVINKLNPNATITIIVK